jgi:predicted transcriptional regulator
MVRRGPTRKSKSNELLQFISRNPGLNVEEISTRLGWTSRSVRLVLGRLVRTGQVLSRYFPVVTIEVGGDYRVVDRELEEGRDKLEKTILRLQERAKETFEKCVQAQMAKDDHLASMYANQCAEIKKLINAVAASEDVLNKMSLSLESLRLNLRRKSS